MPPGISVGGSGRWAWAAIIPGAINAEATDQRGRPHQHQPPIDAIVVPRDRFFSATVRAGRLHIADIGDQGSWDPARIVFTREHAVHMIIPGRGGIKVLSVKDLDAEIERSRDRPDSTTLYVHEDLLDVAKQRWEKMRRDSKR